MLDEARKYIENESNWPEGAIRLVHHSSGIISFWKKGDKEVYSHYRFYTPKLPYKCEYIDRVEVFPPLESPDPLANFSLEACQHIISLRNWPGEVAQVHIYSHMLFFMSGDKKLIHEIKCVTGIKQNSVTLTRAEVFPNIKPTNSVMIRYQQLNRAVRSNTPAPPNNPSKGAGTITGRKAVYIPHPAQTPPPVDPLSAAGPEPTLPTLITSGRWFPVYDTPGFDSGLKPRGVSAERMVQIIMAEGKTHLEAVVTHNLRVNLGEFTSGNQQYKWKPLDNPYLPPKYIEALKALPRGVERPTVEEMQEQAKASVAKAYGVPKGLLGEKPKDITESLIFRDGGDELDSAGIPWDSHIHTANKGKLKNGTWRLRRKPPLVGRFYTSNKEAFKHIKIASGDYLDRIAHRNGLKRRVDYITAAGTVIEPDNFLRRRILKKLEK